VVKFQDRIISKPKMLSNEKPNQIAPEKILAMSNLRLDIARELLLSFSTGKVPADKALAAAFRRRKFAGARDRRFVNESIFSLFRWWGWIRTAIGADCEIRKLADNADDIKKLSGALSLASELEIFLSNKNDSEVLSSASAFFAAHSSTPEHGFKASTLFPDFFERELSPDLDFEKICSSFQKRAPVWLRMQNDSDLRVKTYLTENNIAFESSADIPNAIKLLTPRINICDSEIFRSGLFEVQDFASQCIGLCADPKPGEKWLDACAGAGGKTLQMTSMMNDKGIVYSCDINASKLEESRKRASRASFSNIKYFERDSSAPEKRWLNFFDGVLVDAPCSSSGAWRRNPDARWRLVDEEIKRFHELQFQILKASAITVRPGGALLYATCSVFKKENEDVITRFLSENSNFHLSNFINPCSGKTVNGMTHIEPWEKKSDAIFIAKMSPDSVKASPS
jgi:16S rRNA (cytosine967-C5)-methyltransferase